MSLRSGFVARGFLFLGPSVASFGYMDGTDIPYVPGSEVTTGPAIVTPGPITLGVPHMAPRILAAHEAKRKKGRG